MAGYKGVGVIFIRKLVRARSAEVEAKLLESLSEEERDRFAYCTAGEWVPIELIDKLATAAAPLAFPDDEDPLYRMGIALAEDNLSGVYSFMMRVLTVQFLLKQNARFWSTYHNAGVVTVRQISKHAATLMLTEYPDLPENFRQYMAGFLHGSIQMAGGDRISVEHSGDPSCWEWASTWS